MSTPSSPSFDVQYQQYQHGPKGPRRPRGRWIWAASGVIMLVAIIASASTALDKPNVIRALPMGVKTRTLSVSVPLTGLSVKSYGGNVRVIGGGSGTQVTERVYYDPEAGPAPDVANSVSNGQLTLTVPSCVQQDCLAEFIVTVPSTASVTAVTRGGNVAISGVAGATIDSGGGTVTATSVSGPLTVTSESGTQILNHIGGPLMDESGGGAVSATGLAGSSAVIVTDGGQLIARRLSVQKAILSSAGSDASVEFATAPSSVDIVTDGGDVTVVIPGGPYALTADSGGGPEVVGIPTSASARATLSVTTGGGPLGIEPATGGPAADRTAVSFPSGQQAVPVVRPAPPARPAPLASPPPAP